MFLKYPIICSHIYCYSNITLTPPWNKYEFLITKRTSITNMSSTTENESHSHQSFDKFLIQHYILLKNHITFKDVESTKLKLIL